MEQDALQFKNVLTPVSQADARGQGGFQAGDKVPFRVLEALPGDRYLILARQQRMEVGSQVPLEVGGKYLAETFSRGGEILFMIKPDPAAALGGLWAQKPGSPRPLAAFLKLLMGSAPSAPGQAADLRTGQGVRQAFRHCGMFYEARLRQALQQGRQFPFLQDLKGFLLQQLARQGAAPLQETVAGVLKALEAQQLLSAESGPDGPLFFWLPFEEQTFIEGFLKRQRSKAGDRYVLTCRVPFLEGEELLMTLAWQPEKVEIHFSPGPQSLPLLKGAAGRLEEQLRERGFSRVSVTVSRQLPEHLAEEMKGIRFFESYG